jgi:hypothetical protein
LCAGPCDWGDERRHEKGGTFGATVHWYRARVTRAGIYDFLKLCSITETPVRDLPVYEQIWVHSTYATKTARRLGITIPSMVTKNDRLRVRSLLPPEIPSSNVVYKWTHKETV